jgi:hypothetical protein
MRIFLIVVVLIFICVLALAWYAYLNRQDILDKSIDKIIESNLPGYIDIDGFQVNLENKTIVIDKLKILNPKGFQRPYLATIESIHSSYSYMDEKNIFKGIRLSDIELENACFFIERDTSNRLNVALMQELLQDTRPKKSHSLNSRILGIVSYLVGPIKNIRQLLKLDAVFDIPSGKIFFEDYHIDSRGYTTLIDDIKAVITLDVQEDFKGILGVTSHGRGTVNAKGAQELEWDLEYDLSKARITMSSTLDMYNIDFLHFKPYYDAYSPFIFEKGRASGRLIFNVDDGQIGSDNEIRFSGLDIQPKKDYNINRYWSTGAEDLQRYFASTQGDIVFDFKIKGPIDEPRFYLGSKTKRALTYMIIDKVAGRIFKRDDEQSNPDAQPPIDDSSQEKKTNLERVIDILQGL